VQRVEVIYTKKRLLYREYDLMDENTRVMNIHSCISYWSGHVCGLYTQQILPSLVLHTEAPRRTITMQIVHTATAQMDRIR
jgi:hypothetical protein